MFGDTSLIQRSLKRSSGAPRALGVFAVAWLSLALQPCAMAAGEDGGCPGCPPGSEHDGMSHHAAPDTPDTPDTPDDAGVPCAVDGFDCPGGEVYSHDARGGKLPLKNAQGGVSGEGPDGGVGYGAVAVLDTANAHLGMPRASMPFAVRRESVDPRAGPSRNVLFCVYLK